MMIPKLNCVSVKFQCLEEINNLNFYAGIYWSAMFRTIYKQVSLNALSEDKIRIVPRKSGIFSLKKGEFISATLIFPEQVKDNIIKIIHLLNNKDLTSLQFPKSAFFHPEKTIEFVSARNELTGKDWNPSDNRCLTKKDMVPEIDKLAKLNIFSLLFYTPLRIPRPENFKQNHHRYFDDRYFDFAEFIDYLYTFFGKDKKDLPSFPKIIEKNFLWHDIPYADKTLGGVLGGITVKGDIDAELAEILVTGQYTGVGRNRAFGFGCYKIQELGRTGIIFPKNPEQDFLSKIVTPANLEKSLSKMSNHSPGPDTMTVKDLKKAGCKYLSSLCRSINDLRYSPGESLLYFKRKADSGNRKLQIYNISDRLIMKVISSFLSDFINIFLLDVTYAYRKGYGVKKAVGSFRRYFKMGYKSGIKCDIDSFFNNVKIPKLFLLLKALLMDDPLLKIIETFFDPDNGLPMGNAISPVLSNFYLINFDKNIAAKKLKLIRYGDDIIVLSKENKTKEDLIKIVTNELFVLGLDLNKDKTEYINPGSKVDFLGHAVSAKRIETIITENPEFNWLPVFNFNFKEGLPLYITFRIKFTHTYGNYIYLQYENKKSDRIAWSEIQRIVVIGRPRVSAGVIRKALLLNKPVNFLNILGKPIGSFYPENQMWKVETIYNKSFSDYKTFKIIFIKKIVQAKINNQGKFLKKRKINELKFGEYENRINTIQDIEKIRGIEGSASALFFKHLKQIVKPFSFEKRIYHPPVGEVNVMLSLGYSLLYNRISEALVGNALNPYLGIYHLGRGKHKALASDLVECFRFLAEMITVSSIKLKIISTENFTKQKFGNSEYTRLSADGFKKYIRRFERTMSQKAPENKLSYSQLINEEVKTLIRSLRLGIEFKPYRLK